MLKAALYAFIMLVTVVNGFSALTPDTPVIGSGQCGGFCYREGGATCKCSDLESTFENCWGVCGCGPPPSEAECRNPRNCYIGC